MGRSEPQRRNGTDGGSEELCSRENGGIPGIEQPCSRVKAVLPRLSRLHLACSVVVQLINAALCYGIKKLVT